MKRLFIFTCLFLSSIFSYGQKSGEVLKFLGFPVDGSKEKMIQNLRTKGFTYNAKYDNLTGKFNGHDASIYISTNYGKVDRVYVGNYNETKSEAEIIIAFNTLLKQFEGNSKYTSLVPNESIKSGEDISYEMSVNNKRYQASFWLLPQIDTVEFYNHMNLLYSAKFNNLHTDEEAYNKLTEEEKEKLRIEMLIVLCDELEKRAIGCVWFMIHEEYGEYSIGIYYDNLKNRPNGEDL